MYFKFAIKNMVVLYIEFHVEYILCVVYPYMHQILVAITALSWKSIFKEYKNLRWKCSFNNNMWNIQDNITAFCMVVPYQHIKGLYSPIFCVCYWCVFKLKRKHLSVRYVFISYKKENTHLSVWVLTTINCT